MLYPFNYLQMTLVILIFLAGIGQISLVLCSLAIPRILHWRDDVAQLQPLTRQVFWTYAAYILCINLSFGLISTFAPRLLVDGSVLAGLLDAFICVYWMARVLIQFFYFDRTDAPQGVIFKLGEMALVTLFIYLTGVYGLAAAHNFQGIPH